MKRIISVLAVAAVMAMMMAASAMPAFAGSINANTTNDTGASPNANGNNCNGVGSSEKVSGNNANPGSHANPDTNFTNPVTGGPTWNGPFTSSYATGAAPGSSGPGVSNYVGKANNGFC